MSISTTPEVLLAQHTGLPLVHCLAFVHPEDKARLVSAITECLVTPKQKAILSDLGLTIEDLLDEMYSVPEMDVVGPLFEDWNSKLKKVFFRMYQDPRQCWKTLHKR